MPNVNDLKNSQFLTKEDVEPPVKVTIKSYNEQNVELEGEPERKKWTLFFHELDKPLVLNMTNGQRIQVITGSGEFKDWIGKQITLYNDKTVSFAGKLTGGIRVFVPPPTGIDPSKAPVPDPSIQEPKYQANPDYVGDLPEGICPNCQKPLEDCTCDIPF